MTYLTMDDLRKRGWNERLVRCFLGEPDDIGQRHSNHSGRPHRMYLLERVVSIENNRPEFTAEKKRSAEFANRPKRAIEAKRLYLEQVVSEITMPPMTLSYEKVIAEAISKINTPFTTEFGEE